MKIQNPVVWFEIYVDDMLRAKKFYETVFETELSPLKSPTDDELQMMAFPGDMEVKGRVSGCFGPNGRCARWRQQYHCIFYQCRLQC